jgi:hypothetical protein
MKRSEVIEVLEETVDGYGVKCNCCADPGQVDGAGNVANKDGCYGTCTRSRLEKTINRIKHEMYDELRLYHPDQDTDFAEFEFTTVFLPGRTRIALFGPFNNKAPDIWAVQLEFSERLEHICWDNENDARRFYRRLTGIVGGKTMNAGYIAFGQYTSQYREAFFKMWNEERKERDDILNSK